MTQPTVNRPYDDAARVHQLIPPMNDPRRFGEAMASLAHDFELPARRAWIALDCAYLARTVPDSDPTNLAVAMASDDSVEARGLIMFYHLLMDCWNITQESHAVILGMVDPSFDLEMLND